MTSAQLGHRDALVPGPISLPGLKLVDTASEHPMDSGMRVAAVPVVSDTLLMPFDGHAGRNEIHRFFQNFLVRGAP